MKATPKAAPKQQRAILKRNALLASAFAEFSARGFEATTAKSIADRAGVATGTFYQYFHNKDDVLLEITRQRFEELHDHLQVPDTGLEVAGSANDAGNVKPIFRQALGFLYDFHQQEAGLHDVLEYRRRVDPGLAALMDKGEAILMERVRAFVARYVRDQIETTAFCLFSMAEGIVHRHVFQGHPAVSRDQVIETGTRLLSAYFEQQSKR
ncbi:TetR/AcrR family transcriptional regulator [Marinobacter confluentis]|uniref:TetR/AcrR family transcriptional regulator n=1 Tax=Marinobacter confluentis TaxID=1697557 RepID=A0A4Z1BD59_9GAMM|nr:TetR/AcrR family transcriptional regulator [Marinobacter confluentis]TGN40184.1 TetR/AcrR family transcriptional regulator [Marinobacter confluentis]